MNTINTPISKEYLHLEAEIAQLTRKFAQPLSLRFSFENGAMAPAIEEEVEIAKAINKSSDEDIVNHFK